MEVRVYYNHSPKIQGFYYFLCKIYKNKLGKNEDKRLTKKRLIILKEIQ